MIDPQSAPMGEQELIENAVYAWIRDDAPLAIKMTLTPKLCATLVERVRAAASPRLADKWQPISTAPRDGRMALVYRPLARNSGDEPVAIKRLVKGNQHCWDSTVPAGAEPFNPTDGSCHVTHWQPLEPPPEVTSQDRSGDE